MEEEKRERLLNSLSELAGRMDDKTDEYEKRIEDYELLLKEVEDAISGLKKAGAQEDGEEGTDTPDSAMNLLLMDEEELTDEILDGRLNEKDGGAGEKERGIRALNRMIDLSNGLSDSLRDAEEQGSIEALLMMKDILETALTEVKADYADLLDNIRTLSYCYALLGEEDEES